MERKDMETEGWELDGKKGDGNKGKKEGKKQKAARREIQEGGRRLAEREKTGEMGLVMARDKEGS